MSNELIKKAENDILDIINKLESATKKRVYDIDIHITPYTKIDERRITNVNIEFLGDAVESW